MGQEMSKTFKIQNQYQNVRQHWHACTSTYSACTSAELCQNKYQSQLFANVQTAKNCPLIRVNKWLADKICMDSTQKEGFFHSSIAVFTSLTFQGQICRMKFSKCVRTSACTVQYCPIFCTTRCCALHRSKIIFFSPKIGVAYVFTTPPSNTPQILNGKIWVPPNGSHPPGPPLSSKKCCRPP